jgi:hypothetical protein
MVLITPMFPFRAPPMVRKNIAWRKVLEKPNPRHEMAVSSTSAPISLPSRAQKGSKYHALVPKSPISTTIFLPPLSESDIRPHIIAVRNCAAVKLLAIIPAWAAMVESGRLSSNDLSW